MAPPHTSAGVIRRVAASVGSWHVWALRPAASAYISAVVGLALAATVTALATAPGLGRVSNLGTYVALLACGALAVESTRSVNEMRGTVSRDLQTVWYLAIAITLPPVYAFFAPIPLTAHRLIRVRRVFTYRRVFSNATISLAYGTASIAFHAATPAIGAEPGARSHALAWVGLATCCGILAWVINNGLLIAAIHLTVPEGRLRDVFGNRQGLVTDLIELSLAVTLALLVAIDPVLMVLVLPAVVLYRRSLMRAQQVTEARVDSETGVLNGTAWRSEAEAEVFRAERARIPLALAMVAIDHFRSVGETAGPKGAGQVLRRIAANLTDNVLAAGQVGRLRGGEFAIVLPGAGQEEAYRLGSRIIDQVRGQTVDVDDGRYGFRLTVSVGIAHLGHSARSLGGLLDAASSALAAAQVAGGERVRVAPAGSGGQDGPGAEAAQAGVL